MIDAIQSRLRTQPPSDTGLLSLAAAKSAATAATNPLMPMVDANPSVHASAKEETPAIEIFLADADDQSGPVDADIAHLAEQRAMHSLLRYQTQAVRYSAHTRTNSGNATTILPPVVPPVSLYANLPQEWPLARLSVQARHISALLRVTLYRRVAELNFRGVDFRALPREVMRSIVDDFNNIGGDLARRLASLFAFLKPDPNAGTQADTLGLALYADPAYWLYGLLSYCAKACESKIEETNGVPAWKAKEEGGTPDIEATGRTLALMQTVVMSFGRNQNLGKPDLPIHHIHVYFPVQFVHKLVARMKTDLRFAEIAPEEGKEYKRNSESETNSPYIVVGTYECPCPSSTFAILPQTPSLAGAYEQGLLDGNLGQMVSFQSTYKSILRIEVPVWPEVVQAVLPPAQAKSQAAPRRTALQTASPLGQSCADGLTPQTQEGTPIEPAIAIGSLTSAEPLLRGSPPGLPSAPPSKSPGATIRVVVEDLVALTCSNPLNSSASVSSRPSRWQLVLPKAGPGLPTSARLPEPPVEPCSTSGVGGSIDLSLAGDSDSLLRGAPPQAVASLPFELLKSWSRSAPRGIAARSAGVLILGQTTLLAVLPPPSSCRLKSCWNWNLTSSSSPWPCARDVWLSSGACGAPPLWDRGLSWQTVP